MAWHPRRRVGSAWHVYPWKAGDVSWIEVTDPDAVTVALRVSLLDNVFQGFPILTMSQMRWYPQGEEDSPEEYVRGLMDKFGLKAAVTRGLGDPREPSAEQRGFTVHVSGPPRLEWLQEVIRFGDWSLPNIAYATHYPLDPWPDKLIEQNAKFVSWFQRRAPDEVLGTLLQPSDLLFWIMDGRPSFAFPDASTGEEIQTKIRELASQVGLEPVFGEPLPEPEPGCLEKALLLLVSLILVVLTAPLILLSENKRIRAVLHRFGFYYEREDPYPPADTA